MSTTFVTKANGQVTRVINMADIMAVLRDAYGYETNELLVKSGLELQVVDLINRLIEYGVDVHPVLDALKTAYVYSTIEQLLSADRSVEITELIRILSQYGFQ